MRITYDAADRHELAVLVERQFKQAIHAMALHHGAQHIGRKMHDTAVGGFSRHRIDSALVIKRKLIRRNFQYDMDALMHARTNDLWTLQKDAAHRKKGFKNRPQFRADFLLAVAAFHFYFADNAANRRFPIHIAEARFVDFVAA